MAKIKGTNGDDTLVGTAGNDVISGRLGQDSVDGGAGYDELMIDYSMVAGAIFPGSMTLGADRTWSGGVSSGVFGDPNVTAFENVERIVYRASQDSDFLAVDLGTLKINGDRLALDGGTGDDILSVNAAQVAASGLTLAVADDGTITSNIGALASWEAFDLALGASKPNTVVLGAGNDRVASTGARDTIDLGMGEDVWIGDYSAVTQQINLTDGYSGTYGIRGFLDGDKPLLKLGGAETILLTLGSASDYVTLTGMAGSIDGRGGLNGLYYSASGAAITISVRSEVGNLLAGGVTNQASDGDLIFRNFSTGQVEGGYGSDVFSFDLSQSAYSGFSGWFFDGNNGLDTLTLDLQTRTTCVVGLQTALTGIMAARDAGGAILQWRSMETLTVRFGGGSNVIEGGMATSTTVIGGSGLDTLDFGNAAGAITIDLGVSVAQSVGLGSQSYALTSVEGLHGSAFGDQAIDSAADNVLAMGGGDDTVFSSASSTLGTDSFSGGDGIDTIDYGLAGSGVTVSLSATGVQGTGGGGLDVLSGFERLGGSSFADTLTGSDGANRITGMGGDDLIEGLGGDDMLDGGTGTNTATYAHATAAVEVSLAIAGSQNTKGAGYDTLANFANLVGSAFSDTLTGTTGNNVLTGGLGTDVMTGGGGADRFVFRSTAETSTAFLTSDLITDFVGSSRVPGDVIDLSAIDANTTGGRNEAFSFIGSAAFSGSAGQLRAEQLGTGLFYVSGDTNGDKAADFGIYVQSTDAFLAASDFIL